MPLKTPDTSLTSIVAVGLDGAIGIGNELPWRLKSDLKFFKKTTLKNVVIMGRKTFESVGGCLPNRQNIVLTHSASLFEKHKNCEHAHSVDETLYLRSKVKKSNAFVIGGAQTYKEFSRYVDRYLITIVQNNFPEADAHFDSSIIGPEDDWEQNEISVELVDLPDADEFAFRVIELRHRRPKLIEAARQECIQRFMSKNHLLSRKNGLNRASNSGISLDRMGSLA